jgi:hypothetical protein
MPSTQKPGAKPGAKPTAPASKPGTKKYRLPGLMWPPVVRPEKCEGPTPFSGGAGPFV